jgi:hypothetical protein
MKTKTRKEGDRRCATKMVSKKRKRDVGLKLGRTRSKRGTGRSRAKRRRRVNPMGGVTVGHSRERGAPTKRTG